MSFGPELIWCWNRFLSRYTGRKVQRAEAADSWAALSLSGGVILLLSWDTQACGVAIAGESDKKTLLAAAAQTPPIVNALKRHVAGAELAAVSQLRRDKIIRLTFRRAVGAGFSSTRHLVLEAMERYSNLILTDEDGVIIEAAKHIHPAENRFRSILPGAVYTLPPEFKGVRLEDWLRSPDGGTITKLSGFGAPLLRSLTSLPTALAADLLAQFYDESSDGRFTVQKTGKYITSFPVLLEDALFIGEDTASAGYETTLIPLLSKDTSSRRHGIENHVRREISRREKQRGDINSLLAQDPAEIRREAELVVSNLWQIKPGSAICHLVHWDEAGNEKRISVQLDPAFTPQKNAERLFAKYKKLSMAQARAAKLLGKIESELQGLREQQAMVSLSDDSGTLAMIEKELGLTGGRTKDTKKKQETGGDLPPHRRFDMVFALVFVGLSANGNRYVTFNLASPEDIWFHAQGLPGAHVILRFNGTPADGENKLALEFCASLAAWFSKARENAKVRVDYTQRKHVAAIKGGVANVTYKEFKSINADPLFWKEYLSGKS